MKGMEEYFVDSTKAIVMEMSSIELKDGADLGAPSDLASYGITSIINFVGRVKGRLLIDLDDKLALTFANKIYGESYEDIKELLVMASISELNNIIAGDVVTRLNNEHKLGLRLAPPIVFVGKDVVVSIPKLSSKTYYFENAFGKLKIDVAFEGGVK